MATSGTRMATALKAIADTGNALETTAGTILRIVKEDKIGTIEAFDAVIKEAYERNGWNNGAGRPAVGQAGEQVPRIITQYVSEVRRGFRLGLKVAKFATFYELRKAIEDLAPQPAEQPATVSRIQPRMVRLAKPEELIGDPIHDIAVVFTHTNPARRKEITRALERLIKKYAPRQLALPAPEAEQAA